MIRKKVGIIVQRYGAAVNGGAEVHARMIAEHLLSKYDVKVLTSCALDYHTWQPYYEAGESEENGVSILRFNNEPRASKKMQGYYGRKARGRHLVQKIYKALKQPKWWLRIFPEASLTEDDGLHWLQAQGPAMPELLDYLKKEKTYSAFIVFTALYYPGALSVLTVPQKCIFIPTMHDEKASYIPFYKKVMAAPAWIFFNTKAEKEFSEKLFPISAVQKRIVGVGIDLIKDSVLKDESLPLRFGVKTNYLIYVGRIDKAKGCDVLITYFLKFLDDTGYKMQLVMVGKEIMSVPKHPAIVATGFVPDKAKMQFMLQAQALAIPSLYESLSLVLLESFACGVPVLANGQTPVLSDHINASDGGWCFTDYASFKKALTEAFNEKIKEKKGMAGYRYVKQQYSWEKVTGAFDKAIEAIEQSEAENKSRLSY